MDPHWSDWVWQQQHAVRSQVPLRRAVTPYFQALAATDVSGRLHRMVQQVDLAIDRDRPDRYDGALENWESAHEMLTPVLHWKYPDRAVVRLRNECHSYCSYCLEALRVLDPRRPKLGMNKSLWKETLEQIAANPAIREIVVSGGEPLLLGDAELDAALRDIRSINSVETIRLHTRALTFNPFRIASSLVDVLRTNNVTEVSFHVAHPAEVSPDFLRAVALLRDTGAILQAHTPLLRGVNDDAGVLEVLFRSLYRARVRPYYLIHCMPHIPGVSLYRTSVRRGAELLRSLKRKVSNPALPEYVIVHETGKQTVPFDLSGSSEFVYRCREDGWPVVHFLNWKDCWVDYLDARDQ